MNTISKILTSFALLVLSACQGPWDYWPDNPDQYKGVWTYAHVVSGRPVQNVCFDKLLGLDEFLVPGFAFFDSANVKIQGTFNGRDTVFTLTPGNQYPNCFDGPADLLAQAGGQYYLDATLRWDSSGTMVTSHFTASTYIPQTFHIVNALAPAPALSQNALADPKVINALVAEFGDTVITLMADTSAAIAFYTANQSRITKVLRSLLTPYYSGDTVYYMDPPNDLLSHYFHPEYSSDVGGVLIAQVFDTLNAAMGTTSFDNLFGMEVDSANKADIGNRHRLSYVENMNYANGGNAIDSIAVVNANLVIGSNDLLFYATTPEYNDYQETAIDNIDDSRIRAKYNIVGGAGIFAGMLVDTFRIEVKALDGASIYPYMRARTLYCKDDGWQSTACHNHLPVFCASDGYKDAECWPVAVRVALDSGKAWDAYLPTTIPPDSLTSTRYAGEMRWCIANNFPASLSSCATTQDQAQVQPAKNSAKEYLWSWCWDRSWPIAAWPQCGTGLVSYANHHTDLKSSLLEREVQKWCTDHPNDAQCKLR